MRTDPDSERHDALLETMLQDDNWQSANAAAKGQAMRAFAACQRARRLRRWAGGLGVLTAVIAGLVLWPQRSATPPRHLAGSPVRAPKPPDTPKRLTDSQLLAAFPKGSCFLAEVDGKQELVFLDAQTQRTYLAGSRAPRN